MINRIDTFKPWFVFRDAVTGRYVSRIYALFNPKTTVSERRSRRRL